MNRSLVRRVTAGLTVALVVAASVSAVPAKAKEAPGSTKVDPPNHMVTYFEINGVDMARFRAEGTVDEKTAEAIYDLYVAEDLQGDRIHSGRINGIAAKTLSAAYRETQAPVYMEFGTLYWGSWHEKDGLSED